MAKSLLRLRKRFVLNTSDNYPSRPLPIDVWSAIQSTERYMQQLMVPSSLKWFEWLALVGFIIRGWLYLEHLRSRQTVGVLDVVGVILGFAFVAGLVFLISRKRKQWAKWILIFVIVSSAMVFAGNLESAVRNSALIFTINMAQHFVMLVAMALLFTSDAKNYFSAKVK